MSISLCMLVRDEVHTISACLDSAIPWVDEVHILDTGSTDGTQELLLSRYGIRAEEGLLDWSRCLCKQDLRNQLIETVKTDWILSLDADERLSTKGIPKFSSNASTIKVGGYFGAWTNHLGEAPPFADYKLFLFQRQFRMSGLIHENVQIDIRKKGEHAEWLEGLEVQHFPEEGKRDFKHDLYLKRLACAIRHDPDWHRYQWFLGYMHFQQGNLASAEACLTVAAYTPSLFFPVEQLNSLMVLAAVHARQNKPADALKTLSAAYLHCEMCQQDFEMRVNTSAKPWIDAAINALETGQFQNITPYRFAC
ncbi:MAG: glycosyltransferase family 2 protein [Pseudomonadota bacterium]